MGVALRGHLGLSSTACYFTVADQRRIVLGEAKLSLFTCCCFHCPFLTLGFSIFFQRPSGPVR